MVSKAQATPFPYLPLTSCNRTDYFHARTAYGSHLVNNEVGPAIWGKWLPKALATGALQCKPDPEVVAKGLEGIQTACDTGAKDWGASSSPKLVIEIA